MLRQSIIKVWSTFSKINNSVLMAVACFFQTKLQARKQRGLFAPDKLQYRKILWALPKPASH
jgi:lipoprotein